MLRDYIDLLFFLKRNVDPMSGNAIARKKKMFNTTVQSRLEELERVGLVEKVYHSSHMTLWTISYNGKAVLELLTILDEI